MTNAWKRLYMAAEERCLDLYHCGCVGLANVQWKAYTTDASNTHQRLKEGVEEASGSDVQRAQDDFLRRQVTVGRSDIDPYILLPMSLYRTTSELIPLSGSQSDVPLQL